MYGRSHKVALEGSIQDFGLSEIIQFLRQQTQTGILTVQSGNQVTKVSFERGMIVSAETPETGGNQWLTQLLVHSKRGDEKTLNSLQKKHKSDGEFEKELNESGIITQKEICGLNELHTKEILFGLFRLKNGTYRFDLSQVQYDRTYVHPMDADFILLEGMRQIDEWPLIEKKIPNRNIIFKKITQSIPHIKDSQVDKNDEKSARGPTLSPDDMNIYNQIDGKLNVQELIDRTQVGSFVLCKTLTTFLTEELIEREVDLSPSFKEPGMKQTLISSKFSGINKFRDQWPNILMIVFAITFSAIFIPNLLSIKIPIGPINKILEKEILDKKARDIQDMILVYYYLRSKLPENTVDINDFIQDNGEDFVDFPKMGIEYTLEDGGFRLFFSLHNTSYQTILETVNKHQKQPAHDPIQYNSEPDLDVLDIPETPQDSP